MPNEKISGCGFHHVAIRTSEFDKTVTFYNALGFTTKLIWGEAPRRGVMLDTGDGNYLEAFERDPYDGPSEAAILHLCFRADDIDAATELARRAEAEITTEPKDIVISGNLNVPVRLAFFKGPNGEIVELFKSDIL